MTPYLQATAVVGKNSISYVEHIFALNMMRQPLVTVANEAQVNKLLGVAIDRCIAVTEQSGWFSERHALIRDDTPAQVSYTSGTEGLPKGILVTYANQADAAERIIEQMQMTADIREYVGVPATFSFGMGRYRAISAVGGAAYLPPRGFDPLELSRMLAAGEVNALSVVPTLLRILLAAQDVIGEAGKRLRWMEIGSQHMTAKEKSRVKELFPNARIVQHYGLTEASRSTFLQISEVSADHLESVGRPVGHTEVRLGADGRIQIRGLHVAKSRIDADGLHSLLDADGWLHTNDLGHLQDGYLYFDGRADDLINCGGMKIVPDLLEERIRASIEPDLQIAVAKVPDLQRGDGVLVAVQTDESVVGRMKDVAVAALREMGVDAGSSLHIMVVDAMPLTGTGKVQRGVLAAQFIAARPAVEVDEGVPTGKIADVRSLFQHEFPSQKVRPEDTFESLGGDSLRYIQFSLSFEQHFGPLPDNWEQLNAEQLQALVSKGTKTIWRRLETVTLGRAFFMICILALHSDAFVYSANYGAAYFLLVLAGYSVTRWQLPEMMRTGSVRTLLGTVRYIAIPTVLAVASLQVLTQRFEVMPLLLISNFLDPRTLPGVKYYFIEFYIQLLLCAALVFSFGRVRESFRDRPMVSALVLLVAGVAIDRSIEMVWNTDYNYHRVPWHFFWTFALGVVLATANNLPTRLLATAVSIGAVLVVWGLTSAAFYVGGACVIVLYVRSIAVPAPLKTVVAEIAGASMFIYMCHYPVMSISIKFFGEIRPWLSLLTSLVVGIVFAHTYAWFERKAFRIKNAAAVNV